MKQTAVDSIIEFCQKQMENDSSIHKGVYLSIIKFCQEQITESYEIHWKTTLLMMTNNKQQTAVDKAKELIEKFEQLINYTSQASRTCESTAKQCAIIHVNEMIKKLVELSDGKFTYLNDVMHYQEIKQAIETYRGGEQ
jgi:rubrerythrin